jgi:hypothetical protein
VEYKLYVWTAYGVFWILQNAPLATLEAEFMKWYFAEIVVNTDHPKYKDIPF